MKSHVPYLPSSTQAEFAAPAGPGARQHQIVKLALYLRVPELESPEVGSEVVGKKEITLDCNDGLPRPLPLNSVYIEQDLARVVNAWANLPPAIRAAILAIVASIDGRGEGKS